MVRMQNQDSTARLTVKGEKPQRATDRGEEMSGEVMRSPGKTQKIRGGDAVAALSHGQSIRMVLARGEAR